MCWRTWSVQAAVKRQAAKVEAAVEAAVEFRIMSNRNRSQSHPYTMQMSHQR